MRDTLGGLLDDYHRTVVRCCAMKPVAECDFPAFWRVLRDAILTRVGGREVAP